MPTHLTKNTVNCKKCPAPNSGSALCIATIFADACPVKKYDVPHHAVDEGCKEAVNTMEKNTIINSTID